MNYAEARIVEIQINAQAEYVRCLALLGENAARLARGEVQAYAEQTITERICIIEGYANEVRTWADRVQNA